MFEVTHQGNVFLLMLFADCFTFVIMQFSTLCTA